MGSCCSCRGNTQPILKFMGPCILIYFYSKNQPDAKLSNLLNITLHVSDDISLHHQEFKTVHTASRICHTGLLPVCKRGHLQTGNEPVWRIPEAVCTVLNSWWWTERPLETCRVILMIGWPCIGLVSNLMHKILVSLQIIHLLNSSTCFEHYPAHHQEVYVVIVYMQPLVSPLSAGDCLLHRLRKTFFLNRCTRQSPAESGDTRGCIYTITT